MSDMDEKTEELRDIFLDVADEDTLTDHQDADRGSLESDRDIEAELHDIVEEMQSRYPFETDVDNEQLVALVRGFYNAATDEELSDMLDVPEDTVVRARLDLHLVRPAERDAPFDTLAAARARASGATVDELADRFEVDTATMRRHLQVHETDQRSRQVNQRFRDAFDTLLGDMELTSRMVNDVHEDGLEDATEGLESNVSF